MIKRIDRIRGTSLPSTIGNLTSSACDWRFYSKLLGYKYDRSSHAHLIHSPNPDAEEKLRMWPFNKEKMNPESCPPCPAGGQERKARGGMRKSKASTVKRQPFERYVHQLVKKMFSDRSITRKGALVMSSFISDTFHRLAHEAGHLVHINKKQTMSNSEVLTATLLVLRGDLAKHAIQEAARAMAKYASSTGGSGGGAMARDGNDDGACACPPPPVNPNC